MRLPRLSVFLSTTNSWRISIQELLGKQRQHHTSLRLDQGHRRVEKKNVLVTIPGYPQLKSNPGRWFLNIREGRSADIYGISSHENTEVPGETENVQVLISSFKSAIIKMKVFKKKDEELLQADGARYDH